MNNRIVYYDYLRVFATFAVMILHVAAQNWYSTDVNGFDWKVYNFYDSISRWGVPVFVMISGALFLKRNSSLTKIFSKNVFRMGVAFITWSVIYSLSTGGTFSTIIVNIIGGVLSYVVYSNDNRNIYLYPHY